MEQRVSRFGVWIQGMGKDRIFREPNCILFYSVICSIF